MEQGRTSQVDLASAAKEPDISIQKDIPAQHQDAKPAEMFEGFNKDR